MVEERRAIRAWEVHLEEVIGVDEAAAIADRFERLVTRDDLQRALDEQTERLTARMDTLRHELVATFERGLREAVVGQTRIIVFSLMVAFVAVAGLAFGAARLA